MTSPDNSKQPTAAPSIPRVALTPSSDLPARATLLTSARDTSAELSYGCVDWFIYGAETLVASASVSLRG